MDCLQCKVTNRAGRRFCAACGAVLPVACAACGFANEATEKFCGGCGAPLATTAAASQSEPKPTAAPSEADGERRPITVLFADLCGYTRLSQQLDPEDMHALLGRYFETLDAIVVRCGGSVDKHIGDAVMAVFGAPVAHGDDAARAVRTAAEIQHAMPALAAELGRPLAVHIGIATGEVVASGLGSAQHRAYTVIGQSVNLASRLVGLAGPGETVLDDAVHDAVRRVARCDAVEGAHAKGIDAPLRVWRLTDLAPASAQDQGQPFVGRDLELAQLATALSSSRTGRRGSTVYVRGEAGMGKSRLVGELRRIALSEGFACHTALVLDFGIAKGRDAIREIAAALIGVAHSAEEDERRAALDRVANDDARLALLRPFVADLLDLPQPAATRALYEAMDNAARQRGRADAAVRLLEVACDRQPVLLVVEDVHWADRVTLEYIAALTRGVVALRAVLALTSRLEGDPLDPAWRSSVQGAPLLTIDLGPLGPKEALALAGGMLSTSPGFAQKCVERAGGNPLFLEQLMRDADENADRLPASLHSLVLARMDRLAERDRAALRAASVIGQRFALPLLRRLANLPDYGCDGLVTHYLVRPEGDEFLFAHALIRDGVYASLTRARRAELHRAAADWYGDRDPTLRALHLDRAEAPEAPQAYLAAANAQAAAFHLERALALAERGAALARDPVDVHALNMRCGSLRFQGGEGRPAVDAYQIALAAASSPAERCRALLGIAAGHRLTANIDPAHAALDEAEPIARAHGLTRELAELHYTRGNLHFARAAAAQCRTEHEAALACARSLGDPEWEARALSGLADADYAAGRMQTALDRFAHCVAFCDEHGMTRVAIPNRIMMGHCRSYLAQFDTAPVDIRAGLALAVQVGDKHAEMFALESLGVVLTTCARYEEAEPALRHSLALAEAVGARRYQAFDLACLAECCFARGDKAEAVELIERAFALAREIGMAFGGPMLLGLKLRMIDDPLERERCEAEAGELFAGGSIGHNQIGYRRHVIEDALARRDWPRALQHAAALEDYTRAEPLLFCDLIIARARVIAALATRPDDPDALRELARLKAESKRLNWPVSWP